MIRKVVPKSSEELYREGPEAWMFLPYYLAIRYKIEKSKRLLDLELSKHYKKQDHNEISVQYRAREFNGTLQHEMDEVLLQMGITDKEAMFDEMNACCERVLRKYMDLEESK